MAEKFGEKKDKSAAEMRKINKPLMERKRRERINNCLNQLKMFLMETTKKDSSYYSKLEKADILELTVKYLKSLQRQQLAVAMVSDPKVASKYTAGYSQCASEVSRYLGKLDGFSPEVQNRLLSHLTGCIQKVATSAAVAQNSAAHLQGQSTAMFTMATAPSTITTATHTQSRPDSPPEAEVPTVAPSPAALQTVVLPGGQTMYLNSVQQQQLQQQQQQQSQQQQQQQQQQPQNLPVLPVQLIPAKLPSGDMVFLMANTQPTVPMATNFVTSPVSIQIPGAAGGSSSTVTGVTNVITSSTTSSSNSNNNIFTMSSHSLAPFSNLTTAGLTSSLGLPGAFTSSSAAPTSVAVVPPNVHECKPSPSLMPTDLSMKSTTVSATASSTSTSSETLGTSLTKDENQYGDKETKQKVTPIITPFGITPPTLLTLPGLSRPEAAAGGAMSLLSMAAASRRRSEDENNNDVTGMSDESSENDETSHREASPKPEAVQPDAHGELGEEAGPSGLGPMWRPW